MQKAASMASVLVLIFPPAVLIFEHPAQIVINQHSCANFLSVIGCAKLAELQVPAHSYSCRLYNQRSFANFWSLHSCADFCSLHSFANFWSVLAHNQHSFICHHSCQLYNNTDVLCFGLCKHKITTASSAGTVVASMISTDVPNSSCEQSALSFFCQFVKPWTSVSPNIRACFVKLQNKCHF